MSVMPSLRTVHVLAHTHWDREWYLPVARVRQALAALLEPLLAGGATPACPFLLDGQAVVLEDALAVCPAWEPALATALRDGALEAGPWYVLADALIPSGEALVRNLLVGRRVLARFGAVAPPVCYAPDSFGHPAALPALAAGFGLTVGVLWRGYGSVRWPAGDTARWHAPDGSTLLLWHLPPDGYEFGSALPTEPAAVRARWHRVRDVLAARAVTGTALLTVGADHHALSPHLADAVRALADAAAADGVTVVRTSLGGWAAQFAAAASARLLPEVRGELRDSYGYTWTLQGTLATRARQKRDVARLDRAVRWDVEPWLAIARLADPAAPHALHGDLLHHLWRTVLRTLPHDTLCGCSIDAVAQALDQRVAAASSEARGLRAHALDQLMGRDPVVARAVTRDDWHPRLVVRNRLPRRRHGLVEVVLRETITDVPVGPGSGAPAGTSALRAASGAVPVGLVWQSLSTRRRFVRRLSPQHYPDNDLVAQTRALVWWPEAQAVPGLGLATRWLSPPGHGADRPLQAPESTVPFPAGVVPVRVHGHDGTLVLDNGQLELRVGEEGVTLHEQGTGRTWHDVLHLTWQADHGDSYTPAPRGPVRALRLRRRRIVAYGPLRAAVRLTFALRVPFRSAPDERDATAGAAGARRRMRVHVLVTLDAGAAHIGVAVAGRAAVGDHRLRLSLATGVSAPTIIADAAVWPVERRPIGLAQSESAREAEVTSAPLHRWVAALDGPRGMLLVSDGLAEYEALADGRLAVTLQRATGELSRGALPERPGHAGWPARTPRAQGSARVRARVALAPCDTFSAGWASARADDLLVPLVGTTWRDAPATAPVQVPGLVLEGPDDVVALAVKPAEDGRGLIARCVNLADAPRGATWCAPWPGVSAELVRLDETSCDEPPCDEPPCDGRRAAGAVAASSASDPSRPTLRSHAAHDGTRCELALPPYAIASLRLTRAPAAADAP